jgi:hypothetical protein
MSIEAIKKALEALEQMQSALTRCMGSHKAEEGDRHRALAQGRTAITTLRVAIASYSTAIKQAEKQEPVADKAFEKWWDEEGSTAPKHRLDCEEHCYQIAKIAWSNGAYKAHSAYTTPPAAPVQEPDYETLWHKVWPDAGSFVRVSADDLTKFAKAVSATPPAAQRQWVSLTDEEVNYIADEYSTQAAIRATEAKLRKLNGGQA